MYPLAFLQLVITLGWMAYAYYQPPILQDFGFGSLAGFLAIYLAVVGGILAPIVGHYGDRIASRGGDRFSLVVAGGLLAGATFVAVASTVAVAPDGPLRFAVPLLVLLWIAAMTVLQAPALSLLPRIAASSRWPAVMPPLVIATVLPNALWPFVHCALDRLGGPLTFLVGGIAVLAATWLLRRAMHDTLPAEDNATAHAHSLSPTHDAAARSSFALLFTVGVTSAFVTRLATDLTPNLLATQVTSSDESAGLFAAASLGAAAVLARSLGSLGTALGARKSVIASTVSALACAIVTPLCTTLTAAIALALLLGAALGLHLDSALPYSLAALDHRRPGLASGLYLGGIFTGSQLAAVFLS